MIYGRLHGDECPEVTTHTTAAFRESRKRHGLTVWQRIMKQDIERAIRWWLPGNYRLSDREQRKDDGTKKMEKGGVEHGSKT